MVGVISFNNLGFQNTFTVEAVSNNTQFFIESPAWSIPVPQEIHPIGFADVTLGISIGMQSQLNKD
jgi:hypothetical protein